MIVKNYQKNGDKVVKKKIICTLTAVCLLASLTFTGCKDSENTENTTLSPVADQTQSNESLSSAEETTTTSAEVPSEENIPANASSAAETYFRDAAFIGDSVSMALRNRSTSTGKLSGATFFVRGSYGSGHAVNDTMLLTYQGMEMTPEDAIKASGAKKIFIMLGMNDLNIYGLEGTVENWDNMIKRIKEKNPDVKICIQTMSPIVTGSEAGKLNNPDIDKYNVMLRDFALKNNFAYIDVATPLKDATNGLEKSYCSDNYVHLSDMGCDVWIAKLEQFAENQYL